MNFIEVAKNCINRMSHKAVNIKNEPKIIVASFGGFDIGIYYSSFEYEVGFNYFCCNQKVRSGLSFALLAAGCPQERLPKFINMSNEQIMQDYIMSYMALVDEYYDLLTDTVTIQQKLKKL